MIIKWLKDNALQTFLLTRRRGELVGQDEEGNSYYRERGAVRSRDERRWIVYRDGPSEIEASNVPAGWHAWLHHNRDKAPSEEPLVQKRWEKPHQPNLTGTPAAYKPPGHELRGGKRDAATGDYEAWRP